MSNKRTLTEKTLKLARQLDMKLGMDHLKRMNEAIRFKWSPDLNDLLRREEAVAAELREADGVDGVINWKPGDVAMLPTKHQYVSERRIIRGVSVAPSSFASIQRVLGSGGPPDGYVDTTDSRGGDQKPIMASLLQAPKFPETWCSQCGRDLGAGDNGLSHCSDHKTWVRGNPLPV